MKKNIFTASLLALMFVLAGPANAHYGMVIPSDTMVMQEDRKSILPELIPLHSLRQTVPVTSTAGFGVAVAAFFPKIGLYNSITALWNPDCFCNNML